MNGHTLAQTILSGDSGSFVVCFALLVFSGLLRPLARSALELAERPRPGKPRPDISPDRTLTSPITLSSIELALIAELSVEQARDHDAVAADVTQRLETRQRASEAAIAWRERARILHLEAQRRIGQPMVPGRSAHVTASAYTGPERRRQMRRRHTPQEGPEDSSDGHGSREHTSGPERRRRERRRPELAPR